MDELSTTIEAVHFRKAMSHFASGVTVVTTEDEGDRYGLTVSAFSSLSLTPPLVLVCIEKVLRTHDAIIRTGKFAVNILAAEQQEISNRFASKVDDRFAGVPTSSGLLSLPLIDGALAHVQCRLHEVLPGGDHSIFVGAVMGANLRDGDPLLYFRSSYVT